MYTAYIKKWPGDGPRYNPVAGVTYQISYAHQDLPALGGEYLAVRPDHPDVDELSRRQADALLVQHGFRRTGEWTERSRLHSVAEVTRPPEPLDGEVALLLTPGGRGVLARVDRMHGEAWMMPQDYPP